MPDTEPKPQGEEGRAGPGAGALDAPVTGRGQRGQRGPAPYDPRCPSARPGCPLAIPDGSRLGASSPDHERVI